MYNFVKTGAYAGQTVNLGGYQFVDGVHTLGPNADGVAPSPADAKALGDYLAKCYEAYPEGSTELAAAQAGGKPLEDKATHNPPDPNRERIAKVRDALTKLDTENDEHWTTTGLASVEAVRTIAENAELSRADINEAAPKLTREEARKAKNDPIDN